MSEKRDWKRLIELYETRLMNRDEFCLVNKISLGTLYKWRRYYLLRKEERGDESGSFVNLGVESGCNLHSQNDLQIESRIKISNGSGVKLELTHGCRRSELAAIMELFYVAK